MYRWQKQEKKCKTKATVRLYAAVFQQDLGRAAAVQVHGVVHAHTAADHGHFGQGCAAAALSGNIAKFGSALRPEENRFSICVCAQGDPGGPGTGKVHRIQAGGIGNRLKMANAVDEEWNKLTLDIPFSLSEAPSEGMGTYVPVDAEAIPGLIIGEATITETPLGISIRYMETATDEEAMQLIREGIKEPVIVLGYTFPYAYEEMAREMDMKVGTIKSRIYRIKKRMRILLSRSF